MPGIKFNSAKPYLRTEDILKRRGQIIAPSVTIFFNEEPFKVVRASGQYLYDDNGNEYLDCISNVQHVGHAHPDVAQAAYDQMLKTNCNVRFLNENILAYADNIQKTLPESLEKLFMLNSGSEANDLALRIAREHTGATEVIVLEHAYHGHLTSTIALSPYKFMGKGGSGVPEDFVHIVACPDVYRGKHRLSDNDQRDPEKLAEMADLYAREVKSVIDKIHRNGKKVAAFFMEALVSCGGQFKPPPGYLQLVTKYVHAAGGLVVVDEVQTGFGRVGSFFWAFQLQGADAEPDILTFGKPMGNGFPVAALMTTSNIARSLGKGGMEYFNTYGGNPVSCAVANQVLQIIERENLQQNANDVGSYLIRRLNEISISHSWIGNVRGIGLFVGIDLVSDKDTREPLAKGRVNQIQYRMKRRKVIINSEGPHSNVIKIKPPMCFTEQNAETLVSNLDEVLSEMESEYFASVKKGELLDTPPNTKCSRTSSSNDSLLSR